MKSMDKLTVALLHLCSEIYKEPIAHDPRIPPNNIAALLDLAMSNALGVFSATKIRRKYRPDSVLSAAIETFIRKAREKIGSTENTIAALHEWFSPDYVLIKTYRPFPCIKHDVDVLVTNLDDALEKAKSNGMRVLECSYQQKYAVLEDNNRTNIHLHGMITWAKDGTKFFDEKIVWSNPKYVKIGQCYANIPNNESDFLIHAAHINFENLHITLSDLLYMYQLATNADWAVILEQSNKYRWKNALTRTLHLMDALHHSIYPDPCPFYKLGVVPCAPYGGKILFPFSLPRAHMILTFREKRLLLWASKKLSKSLYIVATGGTYTPFFASAERTIFETTFLP